jgi:carbamoyltransferase
MRHILGISAFYHDSAAALLREGEIVAAAQEERFTRKKNDPAFPREAIAFCLRQGGIELGDLGAVVFYDKPVVKFSRLIESYLTVAPWGWRGFIEVLPSWLSEKLNLRRTIDEELPGLPKGCRKLFTAHHQAHAASAFYPGPFHEAALLTVDGVGEYATTTIGHGKGDRIEILQELRFPHSLGLLYSAFTAYCGFRVNSGEYKLMGLAPYGRPVYVQAIRDHLIDLKADGSFRLNIDYFDFLHRFSMTNEKFHRLFGGPPRKPETVLEPRHFDVARSIQAVTEEVMLRLAVQAREVTGQRNLCLAGGVALNCVANGRILKIFERIWIQPAAGDAGGALGAALAVWHASTEKKNARPAPSPAQIDLMQGALLGPEFSADEIEHALRGGNAVYERFEEKELLERTAELLEAGKVVGWVQGRMEFGPRALGNRSILGDPRSPEMQSTLNLKVKFRESFRPFAPAVLRERAAELFELDAESPYMLLVAPIKKEWRLPVAEGLSGLDLLKYPHSKWPAVTHVDYSARVQTVDPERNPLFYRLIKTFEKRTGCPVLVNTSFNVRGEPIVCTPQDAYRCFLNTSMDYLAIGPFLLDRIAQPEPQPGRKLELIPD